MDKREQDYQRELIELKKMRAAGVVPGSSKGDGKIPMPQDFKGKVKYFWYYYKTHVLLTAFALLVVGICVGSCVSKVHPDVSVIFLTKDAYLPEHIDILEENLEKYCADYNGNGKVDVQVIDITTNPDNPSTDYVMQQKLVAEISAGSSLIYISDEAGLERFHQIEALNDITDLTDAADESGTACAIPASRLFGEKAQGTFYVSLRGYDKEELKKESKKGKNLANSIDAFKNIINNNIITEVNENGSN